MEDQLQLDFDSYTGPVQLALYNTLGQVIGQAEGKAADLYNWDLSHLSLRTGLYFLQVKLEDGVYLKSLVKE